jgi:hypothetical protein
MNIINIAYFEMVPEDFTGISIHNKDSRMETIQFWFKGKRHRINGPAIKHFDESEEYWQNDLLHNLNGPAYVDYKKGIKEYYIFGKETTKEAVDFLRDLYKLKNYNF